jgi:hypothetical protein
VIGGAYKVAAPFFQLIGWYLSLSWAEATSLINCQFIMTLNLLHIQLKLQLLHQFRILTNSDSQCGSVTLPQNRSLFPWTSSRSSPLHASCADRASGVRI